MSNGFPGKDCNFNATQLPHHCGTGPHGIDCKVSDGYEGTFINKCNATQKLFKCALQRDSPKKAICNPYPAANRTKKDIETQCLCDENECYVGAMCERCAPGFAKYGKYE